MNTELVERLKQCAEEFKSLLPQCGGNTLDVMSDGSFTIHIHGISSYQEAVNLMRNLGVKSWDKFAHDTDHPWGNIQASINDMDIKIYFLGLPPTCRIVEKDVQIPKTQIVDTGEFITIKQKEIVCGV